MLEATTIKLLFGFISDVEHDELLSKFLIISNFSSLVLLVQVLLSCPRNNKLDSEFRARASIWERSASDEYVAAYRMLAYKAKQ